MHELQQAHAAELRDAELRHAAAAEAMRRELEAAKRDARAAPDAGGDVAEAHQQRADATEAANAARRAVANEDEVFYVHRRDVDAASGMDVVSEDFLVYTPRRADDVCCDESVCSAPFLCEQLRESQNSDTSGADGNVHHEFRWRQEFTSLLRALERDAPSTLLDGGAHAVEVPGMFDAVGAELMKRRVDGAGATRMSPVRAFERSASLAARIPSNNSRDFHAIDDVRRDRASGVLPSPQPRRSASAGRARSVVPFHIVREALLQVTPLTEDDVFVSTMHRKLDNELAERREWLERFRARVRRNDS
ncbi:Hypothetical protein, putative [Bodo saltans]|uniref:Uncharacterized protein n=1 Tax=Bodo saltans TaxID=75058 RepID=A0A0S4IRJ3_BODSA|nr:Hypothetical protein, putative [Bodo saltans]|eukprot:CUF44632.1 Hypothetical protein, putative [Bodo saltans]